MKINDQTPTRDIIELLEWYEERKTAMGFIASEAKETKDNLYEDMYEDYETAHSALLTYIKLRNSLGPSGVVSRKAEDKEDKSPMQGDLKIKDGVTVMFHEGGPDGKGYWSTEGTTSTTKSYDGKLYHWVIRKGRKHIFMVKAADGKTLWKEGKS